MTICLFSVFFFKVLPGVGSGSESFHWHQRRLHLLSERTGKPSDARNPIRHMTAVLGCVTDGVFRKLCCDGRSLAP